MKTGCIRGSGCIRVKLVLFGQKRLYGGKVVLISAKVVVFVQNRLYLGKSCCIRAKWLYLNKSCCIRAKEVLFRQKID